MFEILILCLLYDLKYLILGTTSVSICLLFIFQVFSKFKCSLIYSYFPLWFVPLNLVKVFPILDNKDFILVSLFHIYLFQPFRTFLLEVGIYIVSQIAEYDFFEYYGNFAKLTIKLWP